MESRLSGGLKEAAATAGRIARRAVTAAIKRKAKSLLVAAGRWAIKGIGSLLGAKGIAIVVCIFLFIMIIAMLFSFAGAQFPLDVNGEETPVMFGFSNEWDPEKDASEYKLTVKLSDLSYQTDYDGTELDSFQQNQTETYTLSWALLEAVDRLLGDPYVFGDETRQIFKPDAEKHYWALRPKYQWKESVNETWDLVQDKDGSHWEYSRQDVKLLTRADCMETTFNYTYKPYYFSNDHHRERKEIIDKITDTGNYYTKFFNYLMTYEIDKPLELEYPLRLAQAYDEKYKLLTDELFPDGTDPLVPINPTAPYDPNIPIPPGSEFSPGSLTPPLGNESFVITSGYGYRSAPFGEASSQAHWAIDLAVPTGTPVYAISSGVVRVCEMQGTTVINPTKTHHGTGSGKYVVIEHADGWFSRYHHFLKFGEGISEGVQVQKGQVIGYVDTTGYSTGPHLHFQIYRVGTNGEKAYFDPRDFYRSYYPGF